MRIIHLRFLSYIYVPALSHSLKEFSDKACIAYKVNSSAPVYVLSMSNAVVDFLYETNPNCHEITPVDKFIKNELEGFLLTNTAFLKSHVKLSP